MFGKHDFLGDVYSLSTEKKLFGQIGEQDVYSYFITNSSGAYVEIIDFGCRIRQIAVPDREGFLDNVVRCCDTPMEYLDSEYEYDGALIGRCANRVKDGMYMYKNNLYILSRNEGSNHIHGGRRGFHNMMWECVKMKDDEIVFSGFQAHNTEGYPGNMRMTVSYRFTEENELILNLTAQTDRDTVFNPTFHPYFNLNKPDSDASLHFLQIFADKYTPLDKEGIPVGEGKAVPLSPIMDFRNPKRIMTGLKHKRLDKDLKLRGGYDHNYALRFNISQEIKAAELISVESGRKMTIYCYTPGLQFYSGNFMQNPHTAVCLEPQFFPNSINHLYNDYWHPDPVLDAGCLGDFDVRYKFSVITPEETKTLTGSDILFTVRS